jgi:transcription antitermination protein NusB
VAEYMSLSDISDKDNFSYNNLSRREVRSLIFHLLYAAEAFDYTVQAEYIADNFNKWMDLDIPLEGEVLSVANIVIKEREELDRIIEPLLDNWRLERIGVCTKLVLRLSLWEIRDTDTPSSIIINEAIELAKCFSEKDAYRFVNGILDEACKKYRKDEPVYVPEQVSDQEKQEEIDREDAQEGE